MNADKLAQALRNVLAHGVEIPVIGIDDSDAWSKSHEEARAALAEYDAAFALPVQLVYKDIPKDWHYIGYFDGPIFMSERRIPNYGTLDAVPD